MTDVVANTHPARVQLGWLAAGGLAIVVAAAGALLMGLEPLRLLVAVALIEGIVVFLAVRVGR